MNCLLIHQAFVSPDEAGGTRHFEFGQALRKQGHQLTIVASDISYLTGTKGPATAWISRSEIDGIEVLRAYTYPALHRSFTWRVLSFMSFMVTSVIAGMKAGRKDIVWGTSPPIFQAVSALVVAKLRRSRFLLEVRDLWPEFAIDMGVLKNRTLISLSKWLEKFLYRKADHIVVNSPAYRTYLLERGIAQEKISLIPNGVDPTMFNPEEDGRNFREQLAAADAVIVTYAGALGLANDIPTILRAAQLLKDRDNIKFVLVGDGKERGKLEQMVDEMRLKNVIFAGSRSKNEMPLVLAGSDICLATLQNIKMFKTTYPNKVFDYMAAGRAVVLGIDGVIRDVVEEAEAGIFVQPGDEHALAKAVVELAGNVDRRKAMGLSGREHVVKCFNRKDQAEEFVRVLNKLSS